MLCSRLLQYVPVSHSGSLSHLTLGVWAISLGELGPSPKVSQDIDVQNHKTINVFKVCCYVLVLCLMFFVMFLVGLLSHFGSLSHLTLRV